MTMNELTHNYYFHDSLITKIEFDGQGKRLIITVEFCYWAQTEYDVRSPEVGMIDLAFNGVTSFDSAGLNGDIDYFSILDVIAVNNSLVLNVLDDFHDEYYELSIVSGSVDFICK